MMKKNIYSGAKVSVRFLDVFIIVALFVLAIVIIYLSVKGGFNISFDSLGGSKVATQRLRYGESIDEPQPPTREGYVFVGWYEDENFTKEVDFTSALATSSMTVYACWEEIE